MPMGSCAPMDGLTERSELVVDNRVARLEPEVIQNSGLVIWLLYLYKKKR